MHSLRSFGYPAGFGSGMWYILEEEAQGVQILSHYYRECRFDINQELFQHFHPFHSASFELESSQIETYLANVFIAGIKKNLSIVVNTFIMREEARLLYVDVAARG